MSRLDPNRPGAWTALFPHALTLMTHLERQTPHTVWTFGGGTVLMLRLNHRHSKDIDLFVPDPQCLRYINPRLNEIAEQISADYEENAEFIKLFLPGGEIDIVVGASLTSLPFELASIGGHEVRCETSAEIIAKKMWHRGYQAKARDLFDLCAVAHAEPQAIELAAPWMKKHGAAFLHRLEERAEFVEAEFNAIDAIDFDQGFADCLKQAAGIIRPLIASS